MKNVFKWEKLWIASEVEKHGVIMVYLKRPAAVVTHRRARHCLVYRKTRRCLEQAWKYNKL